METKSFQTYFIIGLLLNFVTLSLSTEDTETSREENEDAFDGSEESVAIDLPDTVVSSEESFISIRDFRVRSKEVTI